MIYVFFGEFYHFNTTILGILENFFYEYPKNILNIMTLYDYGIILKKQFGKNINLVIPQEENTLYISYRRGFEGNPSTGHKDNFDLIKKYGSITPKSKLIETNSWFENCEYLIKWCKDHKYPEKGKDMHGNQLGSKNKPLHGWSYYTYLKLKFRDMRWLNNCPESSKDIYQLYNDLLLPFIIRKNIYHNNFSLYNIKKKIEANSKINYNNYISLFPRLRGGQWKETNHCSYVDPIFWSKLLEKLNINFPYIKIIVHGHHESCRESLTNYKNLVFTENMLDSINYLNNSKLLITPISGFGRLAMNCGIKNILEILQAQSTYLEKYSSPNNVSVYGNFNYIGIPFNPFRTNIYSVKYTNMDIVISTINKIILD